MSFDRSGFVNVNSIVILMLIRNVVLIRLVSRNIFVCSGLMSFG